jgi:GTP-binding protein HflX
LNTLTDADVLVADRLFATLDPRTRRLHMPGGEQVLCSDTVGFVRKLPHQLVRAFHSTLEVVGESDLLVHVVDAAAADPEGQIDAVRSVLVEIEAADVPELLAINKGDCAPDTAKQLLTSHPDAIGISAKTGAGIDRLLGAIGDRLRANDRLVDLMVPYDRGDVLAALRREGEVLSEHYDNDAARLRARLDEAGARRYAEFVV